MLHSAVPRPTTSQETRQATSQANIDRLNKIDRIDRIERDDLLLFLNACITCTGQREFYQRAGEQRVSIDFLHDYVHGNYPELYTLCLAAGINDFNKAAIIRRLLKAGAPRSLAERRLEGALIAATLRDMPPQRVYRLFEALRQRRVNNRRTKAIVREWLAQRDLSFDAVKYGKRLRSLARHAHMSLGELDPGGEAGAFVFEGAHSRRSWQTSLFDTFRRAKYDLSAIFALPYTIAEGIAAQRGMARKKFLDGIWPNLTKAERERLDQALTRAKIAADPVELARMPLTKLVLYILSQTRDERRNERPMLEEALGKAADRVARRARMRLGSVRAVIDCSYSSRGSGQKQNHPLAAALAAHYVLERSARDYRAIFTAPCSDPLLAYPHGQSDIAGPLVHALRDKPELIIIISDGFENAPPGGTAEVARLYAERIAPKEARPTEIVHLNPVFDSTEYMPRPLAKMIPTVGLRDAEDLPTALAMSRFALGSATLGELLTHLQGRAAELLEESERRKASRLAQRDKIDALEDAT